MADREKRGEDGNPKFWTSWEQTVLDEIKSIFHNYLMAIICWENEK